jgi:hypothetical protein
VGAYGSSCACMHDSCLSTLSTVKPLPPSTQLPETAGLGSPALPTRTRPSPDNESPFHPSMWLKASEPHTSPRRSCRQPIIPLPPSTPSTPPAHPPTCEYGQQQVYVVTDLHHDHGQSHRQPRHTRHERARAHQRKRARVDPAPGVAGRVVTDPGWAVGVGRDGWCQCESFVSMRGRM